MAPYDPPCTHYAHVRVDLYDEDMVWAFVGMRGWRLYDLTQKLGLSYLWYDKSRKIIEIWGSYAALKKDPGSKILKKLATFVEKVYISGQGLDKENIPIQV
jgi:hypothetical protein